jgi:hypothetical protein
MLFLKWNLKMECYYLKEQLNKGQMGTLFKWERVKIIYGKGENISAVEMLK